MRSLEASLLVLPDRVVARGCILIEGDRIAAIEQGAGDRRQESGVESQESGVRSQKSEVRSQESEYAIRTAEHALPVPQSKIQNPKSTIVLPGLINAHTHLEQTFMRGYSANRSLLDWLRNCIWKLQAAMTVEDVRLACMLGMIEALRGGATTVIHHFKLPVTPRHTEAVLQAAEQIGIRLVLARAWNDRGANAESPDDIVADFDRLYAEWHGAANGRITIANGPITPWRCSAQTLRRTVELARRHRALTVCHMNETRDEVAMTLQETGRRPVEWFDDLGVLGPDFHAIHGVWLSDAERELLARRGATVAHCPAANMILASGVAPVTQLLRDGVNVALGTDGPASNDGQDMIEMMRLAAYLARVTTLDPRAISPRQAVELATVNGAIALGDASLGRLMTGAKADLVMLDLNAAHIQPIGDPLSAVVYNARGSDVDTVIVDGRALIADKRVLVLDEAALLDECRDRAAHLARRAGVEI